MRILILFVVVILAILVHVQIANASLVVFEPQHAKLPRGAMTEVEFFILSETSPTQQDIVIESPEDISVFLRPSARSGNVYPSGTLAIVASSQGSPGLHFVNLHVGNEQFVLPVTIIENSEPIPWNHVLIVFAVTAIGIALTVAATQRKKEATRKRGLT